MATPEEIASNDDDCAVCWEKMETARKLPCGHLFHNSCLRSWLEQDTSCPTCRQSLNERPTTDPNGNLPDSPAHVENQPPPNAHPNQTTNHFFHFDGSRYVSWLPSFSVEVTHTNMLANTRHTHVQTSQLDNMARQVLQVFPHMPINAVMEDLRVTRSVDFTIENILEGRLIAPPPGTMLTRTALGDDDSNSDDSDNYQLSSSSQNSSTDLPSYFDIPNERGDNNSTPVEASASNLPSQFGGRFSKSTVERESMLEDRKNTMLEQARRRFLSTNQETDTSSTPESSDLNYTAEQSVPPSTSNFTFTGLTDQPDVLRHRRELAYLAAARRMGQSSPDNGS